MSRPAVPCWRVRHYRPNCSMHFRPRLIISYPVDGLSAQSSSFRDTPNPGVLIEHVARRVKLITPETGLPTSIIRLALFSLGESYASPAGPP